MSLYNIYIFDKIASLWILGAHSQKPSEICLKVCATVWSLQGLPLVIERENQELYRKFVC